MPTKGPGLVAARGAPDFPSRRLSSESPARVGSSPKRDRRGGARATAEPIMLGVDCEMCETDVDKRALVGVSVVDTKGGVLLKTLVKPPGTILDLKTDITGLRMKDFKGVKTTLADVQEKLRKIVTPNTVLVGHGLVHDLRALRFDHAPVIDTAMLFSYKNRGARRASRTCASGCSPRRCARTAGRTTPWRMRAWRLSWRCGSARRPSPPRRWGCPKTRWTRAAVQAPVHRVLRGTLASDI